MAAPSYPEWQDPPTACARGGRRAQAPGPDRRRADAPERPETRRAVLAGAVVVVAMLAGWPAADLATRLTGAGAPAAVALNAGARAPAMAASQSDSPPQGHPVRPGDTYWSIAQALDEPGDIRTTVDRLMAANGGRPLQAGDRLVLPGPQS